ncbi:MAG TPA: FecR family protein [Terriglobales bacterium]|nr:FecR family protein [Terriglobales bacterium]
MRRAAVIAAILVLAATAALWADSFVRIVSFSFLAREVQVLKPAPKASSGDDPAPQRWSPALLNAPLVENEKIRTGAQGHAEIQLECGSALRMAPDSELAIPRLRLRDNGVRATTLRVDAGTMYFTLQRGDVHDLRVELPGGEVEASDGSVSLRLEAPPTADASVEVLDGHAEAIVGQHRLRLDKTVRLEFQPAGKFAYLPPAASDRWMSWSHVRDQAFQRAEMAAQPKPLIDPASSTPPSAATAAISLSPASDRIVDAQGLFAQADKATLDDVTAVQSTLVRIPACINH